MAARAENVTFVAAADFLDFHQLAIERLRLERRERDLARQLERLIERVGAFPSAFGAHELRKVRRERQEVIDRLAELEGLLLLLPLRPVRDQPQLSSV